MMLAVDIGNTSTKMALFRGTHIVHRASLLTASSSVANIRKALEPILPKDSLDGVSVASVVPRVNAAWRKAARSISNEQIKFVSASIQLGVRVNFPNPETIGADRLANACEAFFRFGGPAIVADFGTALTFDVVSKRGSYEGGVICPGLVFATDYLADRTALLPHIALEGRTGRVGKSTVEAMRIGARIGYRGLVREIFSYLQQTTGPAVLCATGGNARLALHGFGIPIKFDADLTLKGIRRIYSLNT